MNSDVLVPDKRLAAVCGLFCPSCPIFIGNREDKNKLAMLAKHFKCSIEDLECEGCRSSKVCKYSCDKCTLSKCAAEKGLDFCGECPTYPCGGLKAFQSAMPNRIELWESQERIKEVGWKQWYGEMIEHYSCAECGVINSVADRSCRNCGATPSCMYIEKNKDEIDRLRMKANAGK